MKGIEIIMKIERKNGLYVLKGSSILASTTMPAVF